MAGWHSYVAPLGKHGRAADGQLALQVLPLARQLAGTDRDGLDCADRADL